MTNETDFQNFKTKIEKYLSEGNRNNSFLAIWRIGCFFEVEYYDGMAYVRERMGSDWDKNDEVSFRKAYDKARRECSETITDYRRRKETEKAQAAADDKLKNLNDIFFNRAFRDWVENTEVKKQEFDVKDTSLLKYWFKEDDWIFIVNNAYDTCDQADDCLTLMKAKKPLQMYKLMSVGTFEDCENKRKCANVKEERFVLLECDKLPLRFQHQFFSSLIEFGLPVKSIIYSGGKSYHCLLKIHPMKDIEAYKAYCHAIHTEFNKLYPKLVDEANKDGVRYTRSPFGWRSETNKPQDLIWCDMVPMDEEDFKFEDTLEQVKKYVNNFTCQVKDAERIVDINGHVKFEFVSSLSSMSDIEDVFLNNGNMMIKTKRQELQRINRMDVWDTYNSHIDKSIADIIKAGKDEKHQYVTIQDFYFKKKDIIYDISRPQDDPDVFNMYEPGFFTECVDMDVKEMPSEYDKLLSNLADEDCKKWLINHMSCYFHLLLNGFENPQKKGSKHPLETVPVFYGKSGTGKNTLMDVLGRAICKRGATDISIANLSDDFNEFYKAGLININEAAKGKTERKASKEALKRFTDIWKQLNQKFMPKVDLFNGAYKTISANESVFGVLDIDDFDRRFQYITGGWQKNGASEELLDMGLFHRQEKEFIAYLIHFDCDFKRAEEVFDTAAKKEDKINSMSNVEKVAYWVQENAESFQQELISVRTALLWYNEINGTKVEVDPRTLGKLLNQVFREKKQNGREEGGVYGLKRGEYGYKVKSVVNGSGGLESL